MSEILASHLFTRKIEVTETEKFLADIEIIIPDSNKNDDNVTIHGSDNYEPSSIRLIAHAFSSDTSLIGTLEDNHTDIDLNPTEYTKKM